MLYNDSTGRMSDTVRSGISLQGELTLRDGKPQYLADTPRFISYIRATCERYRELKPLLRLIERVEGIVPVSGYAFGRS